MKNIDQKRVSDARYCTAVGLFFFRAFSHLKSAQNSPLQQDHFQNGTLPLLALMSMTPSTIMSALALSMLLSGDRPLTKYVKDTVSNCYQVNWPMQLELIRA